MPKAILIDDDQDTIKVFSDYLKIHDVEVVAVGYDGKQAVSLYEDYKPDVVLLDVMMPNFDGFYALENIRKIDSEAKVIMVTADLTQDTEQKLTELKADAIIYKPYEIDQVIDTIDKVMKNEIVSASKPTTEIEV